MAWYDSDTSGIEYWEAVVYERIPLSDSTYNEVRVWRHEEWRNNYVHIPSEYRPVDTMNKYGVYLYGKDANNEVVVEEEIIPFFECPGCGGSYYFPGCYQVCNGPDYAWKVQQWIKFPGGGVHDYQLTGASHNGEPFYEYMTNAQYYHYAHIDDYDDWNEHLLLDWFLDYYDIPPPFLNPDFYNPEYHSIQYVKNVQNTSEIEYKDQNGNVLFHDIHPVIKAVRKASGPWREAIETQCITSEFNSYPTGANSLCMNTNVVYAMMLMNSYSDVDPELDCASMSYTAPDGGSFGDWSENCDYLYDDTEQFDFSDTADVADFVQEWLECVGDDDEIGGGNGSVGDGGISVWHNVAELSFSVVDSIGVQSVFRKSSSDLFDTEGNFRPFSVRLDRGLYYVHALFKTNTQVIPDVVFELEEPAVFGITYADLFDCTIFPVPHIEDKFSMNMQAIVGMAVTYEAYDFQGNRIHRAYYNLREGHDADHEVVPSNPIPEGMLVHKFTFVDGSQHTVTTMRQPN